MVERKVIYEINVPNSKFITSDANGSEADIAAFGRAMEAVDFVHDTEVVYRITQRDFVYEATAGEFGPAHIMEAYRKYAEKTWAKRLLKGVDGTARP